MAKLTAKKVETQTPPVVTDNADTETNVGDLPVAELQEKTIEVDVSDIPVAAEVAFDPDVNDEGDSEAGEDEYEDEEDSDTAPPASTAPIPTAPAKAANPNPSLKMDYDKKVRVRMRHNHTCSIGGVRYSLKKGETYPVPENVKRILAKADLLLPLN